MSDSDDITLKDRVKIGAAGAAMTAGAVGAACLFIPIVPFFLGFGGLVGMGLSVMPDPNKKK